MLYVSPGGNQVDGLPPDPSMCSFGLRLCPPPLVTMLKPMVATAEKVIEQRKSAGPYKVAATFWKM